MIFLLMKLLNFTPNLHTLNIDYLLIEETSHFQYVSIKNLDIRQTKSFEQIKLLIHLFPRLESLKIGINKNEIHRICRDLLTKAHHLFFLCFLEIPKRCLKELKQLIETEKLINNYLMKFINRDLYIWW